MCPQIENFDSSGTVPSDASLPKSGNRVGDGTYEPPCRRGYVGLAPLQVLKGAEQSPGKQKETPVQSCLPSQLSLQLASVTEVPPLPPKFPLVASRLLFTGPQTQPTGQSVHSAYQARAARTTALPA